MARIKDEENICLHCRHAEMVWRERRKSEKEFHARALCNYATGKNRGARKTCIDYEPKKEG